MDFVITAIRPALPLRSCSEFKAKLPGLDLLQQYALTTGFTGHVQAPGNTQSYNRYSYVLNNPLSYTDPSGFFFDKIFDWIGDNIRTIAAIGISIVTGGAAAGLLPGVFGGILGGAVAGFTGTLVATGSLEAAVTAGAFGALSGGLAWSIGYGALGTAATKVFGSAGHLIAHGVARGTVSVLQGGKFKSGFASGFFGHAAGGLTQSITGAMDWVGTTAVIARTMMAASIGGAVSELTGGKFANGAVSAAFTHLFNTEELRRKYDYRKIKGHHVFPLEEWPEGLSEAGKTFFGAWKTGKLTDHTRTRDHIAQGRAVREIFDSMFPDPTTVSVDNVFDFVEAVHSSNDPRIVGYFNTDIYPKLTSPAPRSRAMRGFGAAGFALGIYPLIFDQSYTAGDYMNDALCSPMGGCGGLE